jgi:hypothetical protein
MTLALAVGIFFVRVSAIFSVGERILASFELVCGFFVLFVNKEQEFPIIINRIKIIFFILLFDFILLFLPFGMIDSGF